MTEDRPGNRGRSENRDRDRTVSLDRTGRVEIKILEASVRTLIFIRQLRQLGICYSLAQ